MNDRDHGMQDETNELLIQRVGVLEEAIKRNAPAYAIERRCSRLERWIRFRSGWMPDGERERFTESLETYLVEEVRRVRDDWRTPMPFSGLTLSEAVYGIPDGALGFRAGREAYDATHAELLKALDARRRNEIEPEHAFEPAIQQSSARVPALVALTLVFGLMLFPGDDYKKLVLASSLTGIFGYALGTRERKY